MADPAHVKKTISILLAAYPRTNETDQDSMKQFLVLLENFLSQYPNELLVMMASPRNGIISESAYFPSIADCKKYLDRVAHEVMRREQFENREELRRLHAPEPIEDPTIREKIMSGLRKLSEELGRKPEDNLLTQEEARAKAERWLEQQAELAKTNPPPPLSPALRRIMNLP